MPASEFLSQFFIKINGQNVSEEFMDSVLEIVVETSLYLPEMFTILLLDPYLEWADNSTLLDLGKPVEITAQASEEYGGVEGLLIKGEITALEPEFSVEGKTTMLVRGYNKSHRLHRGKKTRTFLKQKDSDIVSKMAGEAGLSTQADATTITYDYILQNNQTNMEFLQARAARIGYQVFAAEEKLYFKKGEANLGDGPELTFGDNLRIFRPSVAATHQANTIKVLGWDPKQKQAITGQATPNSAMNQGGLNKTGGAAAQSAFGTAEAIVTDRPVVSQAEATAIAKGLANDLSGEFIQAEGVCFGHPGVKGGKRVTIKNVGTRFSGKYFVTSATHTWKFGRYETEFSISGRQPNTISHLIQSQNGIEAGLGRMRGVVIGQVTNLNDPDKLGRIKVKYPWLGESIESDWIRVVGPGAGAGRGMLHLPEVNDEVLVAFEHGDPHYPFVIGGLWNTKDKPPENNALVENGKVNQRVIKSRSGHMIILDDKDGQEQIIIRDKTGKNEIVVQSKDNTMTIKVDKDFVVEAKGEVKISSKGNMTLDSGSKDFSVKCGKLDIQAQQTGTIKATSSLTLEGTAAVNVKNGAGAKVALSGPAVNIN